LSVSHLAAYLEETVSRFPDRPAAADPDGAVLTYREIDERSSRIAGFLTDRGIRQGDRIGLALPKTTDALTIVFGVLKAGAAYVPVDWTSPAARIRTIFTDCQVQAVFVDSRRAELAAGFETAILLGADIRPGANTFAWDDVLNHAPIGATPPRNPDDLAYILYTSGSTGVPKGVTLTHRNAVSFVDWCSTVFTPSEQDRFSSHAPFHFDLSILDIYVPLKHGAAVYLIPEELGKKPKDLARFISDRRLTVWYSTPAILGLLGEFGDLDKFDYSSLRAVLFAGEVFPVRQLRRVTGHWPHPEYFNLYGPTETNVCTFAKIPTPIPEDRSEPYPIGWTCSHCNALVLDDEQVLEEGSEGLLYISGPSVFSGYWGRTEETAAAFIQRDDVRWYNTGDVVRQDGADGFIYVGRRDRMIKRRGYRIELGEIESCLYKHTAITGAAVIAVPHPESGMRVIAYIVAPEDSRPSIVELKVFCNQNLPAYMNPDVFVFIKDLPRTSTNKLNYQELIRKSAAGSPSGA
jgi:amino acid adenylation domain-containing protein